MVNSRRRKLLAVGGAGLSSAFAGCFGEFAGNDPATGETSHGHEYSQFLPNTDSKLNFTLIRLGGTNSLFEFVESDDFSESLPTGSVLQTTMRDVSLLWATNSINLSRYGLYKFVDSDTKSTETDIEWVLPSSAGTTLFGTIDEVEVRDRLQTKQDVEMGEAVAFEETGSRGAYTLYGNTGGTDDGSETQVCVSEEAIIVGPTEKGLGVAVDDNPSLYQRYAPFRWLVRNAGDGDIVAGSYKPATEFDDSGETAYNPGNRGIYSLTFEEKATTLDMAVAFGNIEKQYREALAENLREERSSSETATYLDEEITAEEVEITSMGFTASGTYDFSR